MAGVALTGIRYDSAFAGPFFAADNLEIRGILYTINPIAEVLEVAYFISLQRVRFACAKVEDAMGHGQLVWQDACRVQPARICPQGATLLPLF